MSAMGPAVVAVFGLELAVGENTGQFTRFRYVKGVSIVSQENGVVE